MINWRVTFDDAEPDTVNISYRYQCKDVQAEEALAAWLAFRVRAER